MHCRDALGHSYSWQIKAGAGSSASVPREGGMMDATRRLKNASQEPGEQYISINLYVEASHV